MKNSILKILTKIWLLTIISSFVSCGNQDAKVSSSDKKEEISIDNDDLKNWEEFTVNAIGNTMSEMKYDVTNITVKEGSWTRVNLINKGVDPAMLHNIVFVKYGTRKDVAMECLKAGVSMDYIANSDDIISGSKMANPGETVTLEFKSPKKGNYEFICTYPGHSDIMRGFYFVK